MGLPCSGFRAGSRGHGVLCIGTGLDRQLRQEKGTTSRDLKSPGSGLSPESSPMPHYDLLLQLLLRHTVHRKHPEPSFTGKSPG